MPLAERVRFDSRQPRAEGVEDQLLAQAGGVDAVLTQERLQLAGVLGEGAAQADLSIDARSHEEYYICPKPYLFFEPVRIREKVQRVLTACGGKIDGIAGKFKGIEFVAATEENRGQWPELMAGCDLAVIEEDCLGRELAVMGLPTVSVGENEAEEKTEKKLQAALELSAAARQEMQDELLARGLRNGRKRVMNLINSL